MLSELLEMPLIHVLFIKLQKNLFNDMANLDSVSIKIKTGVYGQFRNLNNKVWFALGEFVDNSFSSFERNAEQLKLINGNNFQCIVDIEINWEKDYIKIRDNSAGISDQDFTKAFEPANTPTDNTGLNEFGMGMKTASIWLADKWKVNTSSIGEDYCKEINFDLKNVIENELEQLIVKKTPEATNIHFTEIQLTGLSNNAPKSGQLGKIKSHLASIYRKFLRSNDLKLIINGEELKYGELPILNAPYFKNPEGESILWKKEILFNTGTYSVKGYIAILETMSTNVHNGLSLFRRGRVIEGSFDEKYRPKILCGQTGSPRFKRIFGELDLEGFDVSFNKGSFIQTDDLDSILECIKEDINQKEFDLYNQAEKYLKKQRPTEPQQPKPEDIKVHFTDTKTDGFYQNSFETTQTTINYVNDLEFNTNQNNQFEEHFEYLGERYSMFLTLNLVDYNPDELYGLTFLEGDQENKIIRYYVNLKHPFVLKYQKTYTELGGEKPIMEIIKSLVLSEVIAKSQGTKHAGNVRKNFNEFLKILN
jgi:Histidine kinase-, DNA gyrase B-, and HSP90-like ATPase